MLTSDNIPKSLIGAILKEHHFTRLPEEPIIPGKSVVVNLVGKTYLYMGDDQRRNPAQAIIVHDFSGGLHFLGMDSKVAIELKTGA